MSVTQEAPTVVGKDSTRTSAPVLGGIDQRAIATYTKPGDLVLDPMAGIGSTLVEAVHLGRDAIGVEYEPQWADLGRANIAYARSQGATGHGEVVCGDARHGTSVVDPAGGGATWSPWCSPPHRAGRRSTAGSPPGLDRASPKPTTSTRPIWPTWHTSGSPGFSTMRTILAGCACLLRPDGAAGQFRRVQGYAQLPQLAGALAQATARCSQPIPESVRA